jgi:RNA polymerase sigma-70 factor (ECF subfamily)
VDRETDEFINLLTSCQSPLYACILSLLPDRVAAHDILQETNITLWRKADEFEAGTNFMAWASRIARYHVLNYRRKRKNDRLVFDEDLFTELCDRQAERMENGHRYAEVMRECLRKLPAESQTLLEERYSIGISVSEIAASRGTSAGAISQMLYRIREALLNCMSHRLQEGHP